MQNFIVGLLLIIIIISSIWFILFSNKAANKKTKLGDSWRQIGDLMRQKYDLILNCVERVCTSAKHQEEIPVRLSQLRNDLLYVKTPDESREIYEELNELLNRFFIDKGLRQDIEGNHDLLHICRQMEELDDKLELKQQLFNEEVFLYNKFINSFPNAIASQIMNIKELSLGDL